MRKLEFGEVNLLIELRSAESKKWVDLFHINLKVLYSP